MRVCDICKESVDGRYMVSIGDYSDDNDGDTCLRLELCEGHYKELKGIIKDWMNGGQCITLVGEDGEEVRLPMPSVPEGTKRLEDFDGVKE